MEHTSWENTKRVSPTAVTKTVGFTNQNKNNRIENPAGERLSNQRKKLRLCISTTINNEKVRELKTQCNRILHDIASILNEDKNRELYNLALEIHKCHNNNAKIWLVTPNLLNSIYKSMISKQNIQSWKEVWRKTKNAAPLKSSAH